MNDRSRKEDKAWVRFDEKIKIRKKEIPATKYKGVLFIPRKKSFVPRKSKLCLVHFSVYPSFYLDGKAVYSVEIIRSEIIGRIKIFRNTYISDCLFENFNGGETIVMIKDPNLEKGHETSLLRIVDHSNNKEVARFIQKSFLDAKVWINRNGIVEAIIGASENSYLENNFLKHLSNLVSELSEA